MSNRKGKKVIFVLFGATGDLAVKKIFPALFSLWRAGDFDARSRFVAVSRREWNDSDFREFLNAGSPEAFDEEFLRAISYAKVDIDRDEKYDGLAGHIEALRGASGATELVFHLSLAPRHYANVINVLSSSGLISRTTKLLIEKPFGTDQKSACELDKLLSKVVDERQIHRVDHYLGKDVVRAVMDLHESTREFSRILSAENVKSIRIRLFETKGIDGRGASYDHVGAFRDVGQNHMLEMLAVIAAELPQKMDMDEKAFWQKTRATVLEKLTPPAKTCDLYRRGQYEGYLAEKGVHPDSNTETAFEVVTGFTSGKLKGTPVILESGKMMQTARVFIEVVFKEIPEAPKRLVFNIQPEQEIMIENRDGSQETYEVPVSMDAYANMIRSALSGCIRDFVGRDEIEALWGYADHVVACWDKVPLEYYSPQKPFIQ